MTVLGHGVDIEEITDIGRWIDDPRNPLLERCFTSREIEAFSQHLVDRNDHIAGRYAAKEAVLKALGTGFGAGVAFTDVEILRSDGSPPEVYLTGGAAEAAVKLGVQRWLLSISHSANAAVASVIALSD